MDYQHLTFDAKQKMAREALLQLEAQHFETEINANLATGDNQVAMVRKLQELQAGIEKLRHLYGPLLGSSDVVDAEE